MNFFHFNEAIENAIGYKIYCDLDGVLVDLKNGLMNQFDVDSPLSREEIDEYIKDLKNEGGNLKDFFAKLPWTKTGKNLWTYLTPYEPFILTAANHKENPDIVAGKYEWCSNHLNLPKNKIIMEKEKQKYAGPKKILIDDMSENIENWEDSGGIGILHHSAPETIHKLKKIILSKRQ
jgi:hypothetical protein